MLTRSKMEHNSQVMVRNIISLHFRAARSHHSGEEKASDRECVSGTFLRVTAQIRVA